MKLFTSLSKRSVDPDLSGRLIRLFRLTPLALLLTLCFAPSLYAQWSIDYRLTQDPAISFTSGNNARCVAVSGDVVYVVWYDERVENAEVYYKRSSDGGITWSSDERISYLDPLPGPDKSMYPSIAVNGDIVHVVWYDERHKSGDYNWEIYYRRFYNGTWEPEVRITTSTESSTQPVVAFSGTIVHVAWLEGIEGIYYRRSTDEGYSWVEDPQPIGVSYYCEAPSIAAAVQFVHVLWRDGVLGTSDIFYNRSTDWGAQGSWDGAIPLVGDKQESVAPSVSATGQDVDLVWCDDRDDPISYSTETYFMRSTNNGEPLSWGAETRLSYAEGSSFYPSVGASGSVVHVAWEDDRDGNSEVYYKGSIDGGFNWGTETRLSYNSSHSTQPSIDVSSPRFHLVWSDYRSSNYEIYYKTNEFRWLRSDSSNGRHLVRDPWTGTLHLVMCSDGDSVHYSQSTDNGNTWSAPQFLDYGKYPTVGLAQSFWSGTVICVAYKSRYYSDLGYAWFDPMSGSWQTTYIATDADPGPPSLVVGGGEKVFIAYAAGAPSRTLNCCYFWYGNPYPPNIYYETMDNTGGPGQPCLGVDGYGDPHGAWTRTDGNVYYSKRVNNQWNPVRVDDRASPSKQPFVESYGDSVFVVWAEEDASAEVYRRAKHLNQTIWTLPSDKVSNSTGASESPTQAWREFTTWSEWSPGPQPDIYYWNPSWGSGTVEYNPSEWSYWSHSQMWYTMWGMDLVNAWTESPNPSQPTFRVLTRRNTFGFFGGDGGAYYSATSGGSEPSRYNLKRDGVLRFGDKSVDYSRDSLVYELPYLDPNYDYYLKVSSYRETGNNWAQALSVDSSLARTVQFAPNRVDTAWVRIPPEAYVKDRKVSFALKNVRGDYVTSLGLTLYQRDPKKRGKGGGQSGEVVTLPVKEVFTVYPNPINDRSQIEYSLKSSGPVDISVYDVMGRLVRKVVHGSQPAGVHKVVWDGKNENGKPASGGIYFVRLTSPGVNKTTKVVLVR